jgi:hypothetical protein
VTSLGSRRQEPDQARDHHAAAVGVKLSAALPASGAWRDSGGPTPKIKRHVVPGGIHHQAIAAAGDGASRRRVHLSPFGGEVVAVMLSVVDGMARVVMQKLVVIKIRWDQELSFAEPPVRLRVMPSGWRANSATGVSPILPGPSTGAPLRRQRNLGIACTISSACGAWYGASLRCVCRDPHLQIASSRAAPTHAPAIVADGRPTHLADG